MSLVDYEVFYNKKISEEQAKLEDRKNKENRIIE